MNTQGRKEQAISLDPEAKGDQATQFESKLRSLVIGQDRAVENIASLYQVFSAGMTNPSRPVGTMLFLGPTGSGKTRVVEATAEALLGDPNAIVKIDCAEFQHSHEIAKLIGSPPGYLGHRETAPMLTQENLDKHHTKDNELTLVLFDEIEKASDALWQLLLGILDKATLTLGDNRKVDFSRCMIFLTSNLGASEMSAMLTNSIGFAPPRAGNLPGSDIDQKIFIAALDAARKKFSPEFMNRIDKVVVFQTLTRRELGQILDLELLAVERRISTGQNGHFTFALTDCAKELLLEEGTNYEYGARHLKRAIERLLFYPLANLSATRQVQPHDVVIVDVDRQNPKLAFFREAVPTTFAEAA